jgi:hypothetical protein
MLISGARLRVCLCVYPAARWASLSCTNASDPLLHQGGTSLRKLLEQMDTLRRKLCGYRPRKAEDIMAALFGSEAGGGGGAS